LTLTSNINKQHIPSLSYDSKVILLFPNEYSTHLQDIKYYSPSRSGIDGITLSLSKVSVIKLWYLVNYLSIKTPMLIMIYWSLFTRKPNFFISRSFSEIVTKWLLDSTTHKLKPRFVIRRFGQFLFYFFWLYRDFILFLFFFSFGQWRGMWHYSHMMWCHRPRRWWKNLEDDIRAYVYNIVTLRQT